MKRIQTRLEVYHFKHTERPGLATTGWLSLAMDHHEKRAYCPEHLNKRKEKRKTGITPVTTNGSFTSLLVTAKNRKAFIDNTLLAQLV